jgi:hypothetical protein
VLGLLIAFSDMRASRVIPLVWLTSAILVVGLHRPQFSHHLILIYPVIAWIASLSTQLVRKRARRVALSAAGICLLAATAVSGAYKKRAPEGAMGPSFAAWLGQTSPHSWVLADNVMDAYRAGRLVPPELAVWSGKRVIAGYLPAKVLIGVVKSRRPERILLRRFHLPREFLDYLATEYASIAIGSVTSSETVEAGPPIRLYILRSAPAP